MSFLIEEYKIPFLGEVKLIEATKYDKSIHGNYYAKNEKLGNFVTNCNNIEELRDEVNVGVAGYFYRKKRDLELNIECVQKKVKDLGSHLSKAKHSDWMEKYQTDNPLQLEFQEKGRQN